MAVKLKRLLSALVVVEVVLFNCWFYGNRFNLFDSREQGDSQPDFDGGAPLLQQEPLLKAYVYDSIPSHLTVEVLEPCVLSSTLPNVPKKRDNFMADVTLIRLFETYPGRTKDPSQADVFVVPYPHKTHCICNLNMTGKVKNDNHCPQVPQSDIDTLLSSLEYLNSTTLKRHLFIASGDYGWNNAKFERVPLLLTLGPKPEYKLGSIVIPYHNSRPEFQPSVLQTQNLTKRTIALAYFYGTATPRKTRPEFQQVVNTEYTDSSFGGMPFVVQRIKQWTDKRKEYVYQTYRQSIFCPCLPGDNAPQKRFFDVIMSGCLPVVLSFESRVEGKRTSSWFKPKRASVESSYPFIKGVFDESVEIDYESFVVQVPDSVDNIKPTLEALLANPEELLRRQTNMMKYAVRLSYGTGKDAHKYDDAFFEIQKAIRYYLDRNVKSSTSQLVGNQDFENGISRDELPNGPKSSPHPQLTGRLLQRFIVVPEVKLLFCYVEKVGCSMFNHLFRMLRLSLPEVSRNSTEAMFQSNFTWFRNGPKHHGITKIQLEKLMIDPAWTKAVFYRDPVTRFLSAFRSKCERGHDVTPDCIRVFGKRYVDFEEALARMTKSPMPMNPHFAPASDFCGGLGATLDYYDVVHELTAETAPQHVEALLNKVGVEPKLTNSLVNDIVRTRGAAGGDKDKQLAAKLGIELGVANTQRKSHNTGANQDLCKYFDTQEKLAAITDAYAMDYATFEIKPRNVTCSVSERIR